MADLYVHSSRVEAYKQRKRRGFLAFIDLWSYKWSLCPCKWLIMLGAFVVRQPQQCNIYTVLITLFRD
jgi:hypothetical protein